MDFSRLTYYTPKAPSDSPNKVRSDLCIYGGTPAEITAAVQASRMGLDVVLLEFGRHLGGMTASGLGATDIGNKAAIGGLARSFYRTLGECYPDDPHRDADGSAWRMEPHVAETIFGDWVAAAGVRVFFEQHLKSVTKEKGASYTSRWKTATRTPPGCLSTRRMRATSWRAPAFRITLGESPTRSTGRR